MTTRQYTYSTTFPSGLDAPELQYEIQLQEAGSGGSLTTTIDGIDIDGDADTIILRFASALSAGDITIIDGIVSAYVFTPLVTEEACIVNIVERYIGSTTYRTVGYCLYPGSLHNPTIKALIIGTETTGKITSHDIQIYDATNGIIIEEVNKTNSSLVAHRIDLTANIPKKQAMITIQVKQNGGSIDDTVIINLLQLVK